MWNCKNDGWEHFQHFLFPSNVTVSRVHRVSKEKDYWGKEAQVQKITGTETHTRTRAQKPRCASERSLMLMCSERQRWCIRWSVELLWVSLCCYRVSSSRQTLLSGLCVGVSQGTGFSATKPRVRASSRCIFSILYDMQGPVLKTSL